jgi:hypothetical protein
MRSWTKLTCGKVLDSVSGVVVFGRAFRHKSLPKRRQTMAVSWIFSAQYGHLFI